MKTKKPKLPTPSPETTPAPAARTWPTLYKRTATGATQVWEIAAQAEADGTATITTTFGQQDGKKTVQRETIAEGKNLGKKNATTAYEQAALEAEAEHTKKIERKHYSTDPTAEESAAKRAAAPMLAHHYEDHSDKVDWATGHAQPKLDGHRCLAISGRLYSREGEEITEALPHIAAALAARGMDGLTVDGELYLHGTEVTDIGGAISGRKPEALQIEYHVYDLAADAPFAERTARVKELIGGPRFGPLVRVETQSCRTHEMLIALRTRYIAAGFEGAMLRWGSGPYEAGKRSKHLLKAKVARDAEFTVVAVKQGRGTHAGMAVFVCDTGRGSTFDVTAPGTHDEKRHYFETAGRWVGRSLTVEFAKWTKTANPKPFHPRALRFRDDSLNPQK